MLTTGIEDTQRLHIGINPTNVSSSTLDSPVPKEFESDTYFPPTPRDAPQIGPHASIVINEYDASQQNGGLMRPIYIDADYLGIASVSAISRHGARVELKDSAAAISRVNCSVDFLAQRLSDGHSLYGVTTGFGGSADLRTDRTQDLQKALVQHQQSGILPVIKESSSIRAKLVNNSGTEFMPEAWVRGAMLIRCKSLLAAHSAVRFDIIELLMAFLNHDMIPLVPLRGSISASGDLQPLSYIAGVLEGNPDCYVWTNDDKDGRHLISADTALSLLMRESITFGPKEGLAVLNGTSVSTAVASLALQESHHLAVLSQVLTAMGVEALIGSVGSFNGFFSKVRPHRGQAEVAGNIRGFLAGSKLARSDDEDGECQGGLKQDRYALRTSPQWMGPQLEDLTLAHEQITIECNSTTDNPLIDVEGGAIHHGGNFQAVAITSAMEKTRTSLQMFGRMLFSQCCELIDPKMNNGLPPNLAADEPSTSYTMKGADINVAAYMSELAVLANPVSSHVMTAEIGNQSINSLALISARYTHMAIDCLSMICASYLYVLCQALDIRAMNSLFLNAMKPALLDITEDVFGNVLQTPGLLDDLQLKLFQHYCKEIQLHAHLDSSDRFQYCAEASQSTLASFLYMHNEALPGGFNALSAIHQWKLAASEKLNIIYTETRRAYFSHPDATPYLGSASSRIYQYIRTNLQVPFHKGLIDRPSVENKLKGIGSNISIIYEAMRDGSFYGPLLECLRTSY